MSDFFQELGKQVCAELSNPSGRYPNNPNVRAELGRIMNVRLNTHLGRPPQPTAQDAAFDNLGARQMPRGPRYGDQNYTSTMPPRGGTNYDQDPASAPISGSDCLQFVQMCLAKLSGSDRDEFLSGLVDLISPEGGNGMDGTLQLTHRPNGNGNGLRPNNKSALDRRRPAQDAAIRSLQANSFARRFPEAMQIRFGGNGR
jgi:hypothetical protein